MEKLTFAGICMRLLCAMIVGLVIGTEREFTHRPAGMRTHILVALGACSVMITGELIFIPYSTLGATPDPARLGAQVITGVGFLGAGTILREGINVKGLTTAASLWTVACLGLAAGAGYYAVALVGMVFVFKINLRGLREGREYPRIDFWQIAAEIGNDVLLGSDSHEPSVTAREADIRAAMEIVNGFGLNLIEPTEPKILR